MLQTGFACLDISNLCMGMCRRGPGVHELRHLASLVQTLLERGWGLSDALSTAWDQVSCVPNHVSALACS